MKIDVQNFEEEVIKQSYTKPVLVDFWAEWCGPCKILAPILEKIASETSEWVLAKVNTEELRDVAAKYNIRSIPNVKLFHEGKVIDEFVGALPESQIRSWLSKAIPSKAKKLAAEIKQHFFNGEIEIAQNKLDELFILDSENKQAKIFFALIHLFEKQNECEKILEDFEPEFEDVEIFSAIQELLLALKIDSENLPDSSAKKYFVKGFMRLKEKNLDEALSNLIQSIREERYYFEDRARKICIAIFKYLGEENPITIKHRRDFGSALYV